MQALLFYLLITGSLWLLVLIFSGNLALAAMVAGKVFIFLIFLDLFVFLLSSLSYAEKSAYSFFSTRQYLKKEEKKEKEREEIFRFLIRLEGEGPTSSKDKDILFLCESKELVRFTFDEKYVLTPDGEKFLASIRKEKEELAKWN